MRIQPHNPVKELSCNMVIFMLVVYKLNDHETVVQENSFNQGKEKNRVSFKWENTEHEIPLYKAAVS